MDKKTKLRAIGINLILFALLFGLVSFNKEILRPMCNDLPFAEILTGSFPNFIAAYIISLGFVNAVLIRKPKRERLIVWGSSFLVFVVLTIEEIMPLWGASTSYDLFDIYASGLGAFLSIMTFEIIVENRKK